MKGLKADTLGMVEKGEGRGRREKRGEKREEEKGKVGMI